MRRLLLAVPFLIPLCAQAQTTAANPVEPFSYGVRTGTVKNPLIAALSSVVPSAQAGSTQAAAPVELFSYGRRVGTQSNPLAIYCPSCSGGGGGSYTLPPATSSTLGGVKVGTGLAVTTDGTVSVNVDLSGYLPMNNPQFTGTLKDSSDAVELGVLGIALKGGGHYLQTHWNGNLSFYTDADSPMFDWPGSLTIEGGVTVPLAKGTGNAFACLDANGNLYRSATACQ
ncbi:hypothetical protein [Gluconobacter albidus]|uniref:hypothetical protein n=1 Tax=Gluconobacter albidus TaxID=318683 RepID=UPI001B8D336D|nr:hypothetical protein [Gluconobacter albidus]MBS1028318.1 hypothetical protein [Gluconobacter albidus]